MRIPLGPIVIWEDARCTLDCRDIDEALHKHESGNFSGSSIRQKWENLPFVHGKEYVISRHTDRNGNRFVLLTEFEDTCSTHVCLSRK